MEWREDQGTKDVFASVKGALLMLTFGLGVLTFLVGIKQTEWAHLRLASGIAAAISNVSDLGAPITKLLDLEIRETTKAAAACTPGTGRDASDCSGTAAGS